MHRDADPQGSRLPIKIDSTSNGEFEPIPLSRTEQAAQTLVHRQIDADAKRVGLGRRAFLLSSCGAAATLLAYNQAFAAMNKQGGYFAVSGDASAEPQLASTEVQGEEFIFDVQGHYVPPNVATTLRPECNDQHTPTSREYMACLGADQFIQDVFMDSDTDMMVLSFVPSTADKEPLTIEEAAATREIVEKMDGTHRLMIHGRVNPNQEGDVQRMDALAENWGVSAWKCYTQWGPNGNGFFLTDEDTGIPFVEKARALNVNNICVHKGIPFGRQSYKHSLCSDIGPIAKQYPDMNFLIYHSGFIPGKAEGPYDPDRGEGIDELIRSVVDSGVVEQGNVYAELGSTWRMLMRDPDSAAHAIGKLVKYLGEDNILWGTDSIWYGSPQDQIQAFRTFQISEALREEHGYAEITPALRAKIFGLNATRPYGISAEEVQRRAGSDRLAQARSEYRHQPNPHYQTHGPKTRRDFLRLLSLQGGSPA